MSEGSFGNVLKKRIFLLLWSAQVFSQFSDKIFFLLMVVLITKDQFSNSAISGFTLVMTIPAVIFGSVAGVFVDRWDKKTVMIISNVFRAAFILLLPLSEQLAFLYLISFLVSTLAQFFAPAETSMIPTLIDKKDLLPANSLFMGTMLSSIVIGFALGEPVISNIGEKAAHFIIAGMYLISALLLFNIKVKENIEAKNKEKHPFFKEFKEGLFYVLNHKIIFVSLIRQIIIFSAFAALSVLIIGFVNDVLYLKPAYFGYLLAASGLGMGLGGIFVGKLGNVIGKEFLVFWGFILTGITLIILAGTNQLAGLIGFEKIEQQKKLYISLNTINENSKKDFQAGVDIKNGLLLLNDFLSPDENGKPTITAKTKIGTLNEKQILSLSELIMADKNKLRLLVIDDKTKKISIGSFFNRLLKNDYTFKIENKGVLALFSENFKNKLMKKQILALKFFLIKQNIYLFKDIFNTINSQNIVLNSILLLTENNVNNLENLRNFLKLNENGVSSTSLSTKISTMNLSNLEQFANILNIEPEEFTESEIQNTNIGDYLNEIINSESSDFVINKAKSLKLLLTFPNTSIIKTMLKLESSYFEIIFALVVSCLVGFCSSLCIIPLQTILQEIVEQNMMGKVFGAQNMLINIAMTFPMVLAGVAADMLDGKIFNLKGVPVVMIIIGIIVFASGFLTRSKKKSET